MRDLQGSAMRGGIEGGAGPTLAGPRVIPGVSWLTHDKGAGQPSAAGILGRHSLHTRTRSGPIPAVSTTGKEA